MVCYGIGSGLHAVCAARPRTPAGFLLVEVVAIQHQVYTNVAVGLGVQSDITVAERAVDILDVVTDESMRARGFLALLEEGFSGSWGGSVDHLLPMEWNTAGKDENAQTSYQN